MLNPTLNPDHLRHDWMQAEVLALFELPLTSLIYQAQTAHRHYFDPAEVQLSTLLNIKNGGCPEDCGYCPQSRRYETDVPNEPLMDTASVVAAAQVAKAEGASRFCMGAAWRRPKPRDFAQIIEIVKAVKALELETCMTLGMLSAEQAQTLQAAGLDYYNHNLDTSEAYYPRIISTRDYQDRLDTLEQVRAAGLKVCCGGIIGLGEARHDRAALLVTLANLPAHPDSVPINQLVKIAGTPLADAEALDPFEIVRCVAVARIMMPASRVRLSAGRDTMDDALQALCFLAGANSIFYGDKLLTTGNPAAAHDRQLLDRLGMRAS